MALSRRGRDALAYVNCEDVIVRNGISMHSRMLHDLNCRKQPVPYGIGPDQVIDKNLKLFFFFNYFIFKSKLYQLIVVFSMNFY